MRGRAPTLLVIEDARDQAFLVGVAARRAHPGLDVHITNNGVDGIAYLGAKAPFEDRSAHPLPDLVILDLYMPELDGFEVLRWLRENQSPPPYPIVVLTGSLKPEDDARARDLGAVSVHQKPTDLHGLGEIVREIVEEWIGRSEIIGAHIWSAG